MSLLDKVFSRKPSQGEFAEIVIKAFAESGVSGVEYRDADFALKVPGRDATIFLHNSYSNYCMVPRSGRKEIVSKLVASFGSTPEIPADFASARAGLMPVIRDAAYYSLTELLTRKDASADPGLEWQCKPFASGLLAGLAYDGEHSITSVNRKTLEGWGVGMDQAFAAAKDNLWEKTDPNRFVGQGGLYWAEWGDSYDSSRMLLTELIYRLSVDGDPVAFVPNRDVLLITGKNNVAGLRVMLKTGSESHFKQGHPVSPNLYVLVDGAWNLYMPDEPELRAMCVVNKRHRDALDYQQQKQLLDKFHERSGDDCFVASYKIYEHPDGTVYSACVWSNEVDSSLPRAEKIAFVVDVENKDMFTVPWDAALPIVGDLLEEEPGLTPVRYRAREFPSAEQIGRLRRLEG